MTDIWLQDAGGYDASLLALPPSYERCVRTLEAVKRNRGMSAVRFLNAAATLTSRPFMTPRPTPKTAQIRKERSAAFSAAIRAESLDPAEAARWWICFDSACRQQHRTDAIWLLQAVQPLLSADAIWTALHTAARGGAITKNAIALLQSTATMNPVDQILRQANAVLLLCTPTPDRERMLGQPEELPNYCRDWATWTANAGRRIARIHDIPPDALHAATTRGSMSKRYTNIGDLRDPVPLLSEGCAFWRTATATAGIEVDEETGTVAFPGDDAMEAFHQRYFPDDIPDEWFATADQYRSHGRGCQETAGPDPTPVIRIREEPVAHREWLMAIHVRAA
jgi:hypothetical protein